MSKRILSAVIPLLAAAMATTDLPAARGETNDRAQQREAESRLFEFTYGAAIEELPPGAKARVWVPVPQSGEHQEIERVSESLPAETVIATEPRYGNKVLSFEAPAPRSGRIDFSVSYRVERSEVLGLHSKNGQRLTDAQRKLFLSANSKVPVSGKPAALLAGLDLPKDDPVRLGRLLYEKVDGHMKYDKSRPGYGTGDALWACDSRFGNCTDFHSLFISMSRSQGLPARFEIGFLLPEERGEGEIGGYHCWAFFHVKGRGWTPVDISEADKDPKKKQYYFGNLSEDRVAFTVGRDLKLVPEQEAEPLNFFVYPHVEVDGETWPAERIEKRLRFEDVEAE